MKLATTKLIQRLVDAGVVPANCTKCEITMSVGGVIRMKTEVYVTEEQMAQLEAALIESPQAVREIAHTIAFYVPGKDKSVQVEL